MIMKGYFDGGNDSKNKRITVATVCGTSEQWRGFASAWKLILDAHNAPFIHTTDAVSLKGEFDKEKGWSRASVDALISDCVAVIAQYIDRLFIVTLSVDFDDYRRARETLPSLPNSVSEICATESAGFCFKWGRSIGANKYHLYFDQGEPFFGHIYDRKNHPKAKRAIPSLKEVIHLGEADMRFTPALQMADLFVWCINHNDKVSREWYGRLNRLTWRSLCLRYENLLNPKKGALELVRSWNLPPRKPT